MKIWKALLLVSFLVYAVHCEEEKAQEEVKDAVADEPNVEDAPQEKEDAFEDEQEDTEDEEESDEETPKEDEEADEDEDEKNNDPSHTYKPKLVSTKKIYVYKNKNVGQCKTTSRTLRCFTRKSCVKRHYYYKKQCIKYLVRRYCVIQYTTTCKFCTKWFWRRCYRIRKHYKYIVKCYNSRHYQSCVRRVVKRINKTVLVKKYYITKKYNKKY